MNRTTLTLILSACFCCAVVLIHRAGAVSPVSVQQGRQLFERNWTPTNPEFGSDGLGPLFNGQSCVACHNQGGVGGGGEAEFNAHTIGIEKLSIVGGTVDNDVVRKLLRSFYPGFVLSNGTIINTASLSHHGGTPMLAASRRELLSQLPAEFSGSGGASHPSEVRYASMNPILFSHSAAGYQMALQARLFQRNTTSLYGAGLIDQIPDKLLASHVKAQQSHPEISGRPSTLRDGRFGKFGWRANVGSLIEFTDQACANEVGLETKRKPQASDPMNPAYRNPGVDISDDQIRMMRNFVAALPAPIRLVPDDSTERMNAARGEQLFAQVGCAVCHVPNMGPAHGIYSDLLLHDMGYELMDLNHAEPYIKRATPATRVSVVQSGERATGSGMTMPGAYYGPSSEITTVFVGDIDVRKDFSNSSGQRSGRSLSLRSRRNTRFDFVAPQMPTATLQLIDIDFEDFTETSTRKTDTYDQFFDADITVERTRTIRATHYVRLHFQPTNFNQEWRTPPLWGVRDSAPYMHDGRAETLLEAIALHDGEGKGTRDRFLNLSLADRRAVIAFLEKLVAPPNAPQPMM